MVQVGTYNDQFPVRYFTDVVPDNPLGPGSISDVIDLKFRVKMDRKIKTNSLSVEY
jgi:hypothetical protein